MQDILFAVEEAEDGSYRASAAAAAIHTEADTLEDLPGRLVTPSSVTPIPARRHP